AAGASSLAARVARWFQRWAQAGSRRTRCFASRRTSRRNASGSPLAISMAGTARVAMSRFTSASRLTATMLQADTAPRSRIASTDTRKILGARRMGVVLSTYGSKWRSRECPQCIRGVANATVQDPTTENVQAPPLSDERSAPGIETRAVGDSRHARMDSTGEREDGRVRQEHNRAQRHHGPAELREVHFL